MSTIHCTLGYHRYGTSQLDTFSAEVGNGIYTNPTVFINPPFAPAEYDKVRAIFEAAAADYAKYGAVKKTAFVAARKKLIDVLDVQADYVDGIANGDASIIQLAGFIPSSSTPQSSSPLEKINSFIAKRTDNSGEVYVEIPSIKGYGTINYGCIVSEGAPLSAITINDGQITLTDNTATVRIDFNKSRKKLFKSLTIGTTYYFYVYATNAVSVSPISDSKTVMAAS